MGNYTEILNWVFRPETTYSDWILKEIVNKISIDNATILMTGIISI
jgi:hypothetical protein